MARPSQPVLAQMGASEMVVDSRGLVYNPRKEYVENGRFYHAWHKGKYMFPCDEVRTSLCDLSHSSLLMLIHLQEEKNRLDIFHKTFTVARKGQLFSAPLNITPGRRCKILDLGCGTGIWSIDVAESVRLSPISHTILILPI